MKYGEGLKMATQSSLDPNHAFAVSLNRDHPEICSFQSWNRLTSTKAE